MNSPISLLKKKAERRKYRRQLEVFKNLEFAPHFVHFVDEEPERLPEEDEDFCLYVAEQEHGHMVMCSLEYGVVEKAPSATYIVFPHHLCKEN